MNRKSIQTETFATDNGATITIELAQGRPQSITIKFPGSGRSPIDLSAVDIKELAEVTSTARDFLQSLSQPASQIG
jgi:hypothetical protein